MDLALFVIMIIVIFCLSAVNYLQLREFRKELIENRKERQLFVDKLMARDFTEYASNYTYMNQQPGQPPSIEELADEILRRSEEGIPVGS